MQRIPKWNAPFFIRKVERKPRYICLAQLIYVGGRRIRPERVNEASAPLASRPDQLRIKPENVRVVVNVTRRDVLLVGWFENSAQEVHRLIQRIGCHLRGHVWPKCVDNLVPCRGEFGTS